MAWEKVELETKKGWLNVSYQNVPDYLPKEQHAKYVKMKNAELEKYGGLTIEQYGCLIEGEVGTVNVTKTNLSGMQARSAKSHRRKSRKESKGNS